MLLEVSEECLPDGYERLTTTYVIGHGGRGHKYETLFKMVDKEVH